MVSINTVFEKIIPSGVVDLDQKTNYLKITVCSIYIYALKKKYTLTFNEN